MKIKKYTGETMQEAMLKVKMDLGKDALIINTRNIRGKGLLKFFTKPGVEVIAAIDDEKSSHKRLIPLLIQRNSKYANSCPGNAKSGKNGFA